MTDTKFKPGQSGNPNGRPKDKTPATLLRKSIVQNMPDIIKTLVSLAKNGDVQAAKVLIDRVCPPLKQQAMPISLQVFGSLSEQGGGNHQGDDGRRDTAGHRQSINHRIGESRQIGRAARTNGTVATH